MMLEFKIEPPIQALVRELEQLKEGLGEKGIRAGLVYGAKPLKDTMKSLAPYDRGALSRAVGHVSPSARAKSRLGIKRDTAAILVGANRKVAAGGEGRKIWQGRKAHWHEQGTKHMGATPFMSTAFQASAHQIEGRFYQGLTRYLERQRAKHSS